MTAWHLNPIWPGSTAVVLLAVGSLLLLVMQPRFGSLTPRRRGILIALRVALILLLLAAMLRPTRVSTTRQAQTGVVVLLLDASRSMTLPSGAAGESRWESQRRMIAAARESLADLRRDHQVRAYVYDSELRAVDVESGDWLAALPVGEQTDLGGAIQEAVRRELGKRVVAVVLSGDGVQTAHVPRADAAEAARELARLEYPLYTVTFGPLTDTGLARDVAVENLPEAYSIFVKNELMVRAALRVRGFVNQPLPVELAVENPAGQQVVVRATTVVAREDGSQLAVELPFVPDQVGQYKLVVRAPEQPGELVTRNNELTAFLTVLEGGLRAVYLYGDLLGEQRLLRRSLNRSPDIQLDDQYLDPRNRSQWPIDLGRMLDAPPFDVLLLESVDARALGNAQLAQIAARVEQGRGLLLLGGYHSFGPGAYRDTPLADALPITIGRFEAQELGLAAPINRDLHHWGPLAMTPLTAHPVTRLAPEEANAAAWEALPPLPGANKMGEPKPRSRVLAAAPDGLPLLVAGDYGSGRVLAFAGNNTHLWWQHGRQAEHQRFWRQAILWLARRDELERHDVWTRLPQRRFVPGARLTFEAGAKTATGDVVADAVLRGELQGPQQSRVEVALVRDGELWRGSVESLREPGDYLLVVRALRADAELGVARASFQVLDRDVELSDPGAAPDQMARLAELTADAGGKVIAADQLPDLLRDLQSRRDELLVEVQTKWQLGDTVADAWLFFLLFVSILTVEWTLRKRWSLV